MVRPEAVFLLLFSAHQISAQMKVAVGLITDTSAYPQAQKVIETAIADSRKSDRLFNIDVTTSSAGCTGNVPGAGASALLDEKRNISAVFGPTCFKDLGMSARITNELNVMQFHFWDDHPSDTLDNTVVQMTTRSTVNVAANIVAALSALLWEKIVVFSCPSCYEDKSQGIMRINYILDHLVNNGITLLHHDEFNVSDTPEDISAQLNGTRTRGKIFLLLGGPDINKYENFMRAVQMTDMPSDDYAVVIVINSYNVNGLRMPWKTSPDLLQYYASSIIIYNDCYASDAARTFASKIGVSTDNSDQLAFYMTLYEAAFFYSNLIEAQKFVKDSKGLLNFVRKQQFIGPFGNYTFSEVTNRISPYRVVRIAPKTGETRELASMYLRTSPCYADESKQCAQLEGKLVASSNATRDLPLDMPVCGFFGELCDTTDTLITILCVVAFLAVLSLLFYARERCHLAQQNRGDNEREKAENLGESTACPGTQRRAKEIILSSCCEEDDALPIVSKF